MRKFLVFFIALPILLLAVDYYFFRDGIIYQEEVWNGWVVPGGVKVLFVDADEWNLEKGTDDIWEYLSRARLEPLTSIPRGGYSLVSRNPFVLKSGEECYVKLEGIWFRVGCPRIGGSVVRIEGKAQATLFARGGWRAVYEYNEGVLSFFAELDTSVSLKGDVYLVDGEYFERKNVGVVRSEKLYTASQPAGFEKVAERRVYPIGEVSLKPGRGVVGVLSRKALRVSKVYFVSFGIWSSSGWVKPRLTLEIENTRDNGLGFPLPDGEVHVFEKGTPLGSFKLEGAPIGGKIRIVENEVPDLRMRLVVLSSKKTNKGVIRKIRLDYENYGEGRRVTVKISGRRMEFLGGDVSPSEKADDYMVFLVSAEGKGSVNLTIQSSW